MLKNLKITTKLVAILVAPVLVLVLLAFVGVSQRQADASRAQRVLALTDFVSATTSLLKEVEREAFIASRLRGATDDADLGNRYTEQQAKTNAATEEFQRLARDVDPGAESDELKSVVSNLNVRLANLSSYRQTVSAKQVNGLHVVDTYRNLVGELTDTIHRVASSLDDPELFQRMTSLSAVTNLAAARMHSADLLAIAVEVGYFPSVLPNGADAAQKTVGDFGVGCGTVPKDAEDASCQIYADLEEALKAIDKAADDFDEVGSASDRPSVRAQADDSPLEDMTTRAFDDGGAKNDLTVIPGLSKDELADAANRAIDGYFDAERQILLDPDNPESVATIANAQASQAQRAALVYLAFALISIVVAGAVMYAVGRSITVPLRRLTHAAYTLSNERLPALVERLRNPEEESHEALAATLAPIDIQSRDEIGQLAESFNSIQQVTIEVAEEQSVLLRKGIGDIFINLARRNQTLLDRQIEFIDQLEANEEDPDQLDNLFKLDHLATRMRRNAESLLVLAGAEPPRRRGRPVALADVVRVAIGEVEDFARIQLLALDEATVGGNVAVDLAHLLSELMENATHFSPPDTMVEIVGHRAANGYIISVSDQGIGMSPEQLAEANHQLARPPLVGLALSRSLGFIVIGRLAQRFDISVKLTASPSGGVTALVTLPPDLVAFEGDEHAPNVNAPAPGGYAGGPMAPSYDAGDVVVIDRDLSVDNRYGQDYGYEPQAPQYEPQAPSYEPQVPSYEPQAPSYEPQAPGYDSPYQPQVPSYEPQAPSYEPQVPSYEPQAPGYEPVGRAHPQDEEFERGLQEILGDEHDGHAIAGTISPGYDDPSAYAPPAYQQPPAPRPTPRPAPVQTVAEQIAAASRAEAAGAELTAAGLVRRTPKKRADDAMGGGMPITQAPRTTTSSQRSPEEVRKMLSRYRSGLNKGRNSADPEKADS